jgi:hypothetical protein
MRRRNLAKRLERSQKQINALIRAMESFKSHALGIDYQRLAAHFILEVRCLFIAQSGPKYR